MSKVRHHASEGWALLHQLFDVSHAGDHKGHAASSHLGRRSHKWFQCRRVLTRSLRLHGLGQLGLELGQISKPREPGELHLLRKGAQDGHTLLRVAAALAASAVCFLLAAFLAAASASRSFFFASALIAFSRSRVEFFKEFRS